MSIKIHAAAASAVKLKQLSKYSSDARCQGGASGHGAYNRNVDAIVEDKRHLWRGVSVQ